MTEAPWWVAGQDLTTASLASRQARFAYKAATTSRSSTTTLTDDPELTLTLPAGMWRLSVRVFYGATTGSRGIRLGWAFTSEPVGTQPERIGWGPTEGATSRTATNAQTRAAASTVTALDPLTEARLYGNDDGTTSYAPLVEDGLVTFGETSTWSIAWAQHTSHADATQVRASSWIKARPIMLLGAT